MAIAPRSGSIPIEEYRLDRGNEQQGPQHLRNLFPAFDEYCRRVPQLIPKVSAITTGGKPFRFWLYKKNKEYEAAGGFLLGVAILAFKALRPW